MLYKLTKKINRNMGFLRCAKKSIKKFEKILAMLFNMSYTIPVLNTYIYIYLVKNTINHIWRETHTHFKGGYIGEKV